MSKNKITITLDEDEVKELLRMLRERHAPEERVVFVPYYVPPPSTWETVRPWWGIVPPPESTGAPYMPPTFTTSTTVVS